MMMTLVWFHLPLFDQRVFSSPPCPSVTDSKMDAAIEHRSPWQWLGSTTVSILHDGKIDGGDANDDRIRLHGRGRKSVGPLERHRSWCQRAGLKNVIRGQKRVILGFSFV